MMTQAKSGAMRAAPMALVRGVLLAAVLSVALVLVFSLVVLWFDLGQEVIIPVNQVVKVLSILCGTLIASRAPIRAWIAGLVVGGAYMALGIALYCAFAGEMLPPAVMAGDMGLGLASGFLSGLLAASMRRR